VHLEVIQPDPKTLNAVKDYWERTFGEEHKVEGAKKRKKANHRNPSAVLAKRLFGSGTPEWEHFTRYRKARW